MAQRLTACRSIQLSLLIFLTASNALGQEPRAQPREALAQSLARPRGGAGGARGGGAPAPGGRRGGPRRGDAPPPRGGDLPGGRRAPGARVPSRPARGAAASRKARTAVSL